jgi:hypothetical protein
MLNLQTNFYVDIDIFFWKVLVSVGCVMVCTL